MFEKIKINQEQINRAKQIMFSELKDLDKYEKFGFSKDKKNKIFEGGLGEVVFEDYFKSINNKNIKRINNLNFDFLIDNNFKIDVKTQISSYQPRSNFNAIISTKQENQNCDYYVFIQVAKDYKTAWILGFIAKDTFFNFADEKRKGEIDDNFKFTNDCFRIKLKNLFEFDTPKKSRKEVISYEEKQYLSSKIN